MDYSFLPDNLQELVRKWICWNKPQQYYNELKKILESKDVNKIREMFDGRLSFGTAGLRATMAPGFNRINELVIVQSAQGLLHYMLNVFGEQLKTLGIIFGYDGRHNSKRFAELSAWVFIKHSVKVYLLSEVCPTPFVAFGIKYYNCCGGVMVTASHNPKEDNGYKVYWNNGVQIISPHDKNIEASTLEHLEPEEDVWNTECLYNSNLLSDPIIELQKQYYNRVNEMLFPGLNKETSNLIFTYTPMHGVGYPYIEKAFKNSKFKPVIPVEQQKDPNPDFPTVPFPNPEEGKSALKLAFETAEQNNSTIILANDPDADRLAVAERSMGKNWKVFTGNELGALLGWWMIQSYKLINGNTHPKIAVLSSTVSSAILRSIAKKENIYFEETLTGFKWMGNRADKLTTEGYEVLFAFEESIGYMCGTSVLDKDGISAAVKVAELAIYLEKENSSLSSALEAVYNIYGWHISTSSYFICCNSLTIKRVFESLRQQGKYPSSILNGRYVVKSIRDLTTGYDSSTPDHKPMLPISKSSQMITFNFENGLIATLRTSGTEPKIKYYAELCGDSQNSNDDPNKLKLVLNEMVEGIIAEFLKPEENSLVYRTE